MLRQALQKLQKVAAGVPDAFAKKLRNLLQIGISNFSISNPAFAGSDSNRLIVRRFFAPFHLVFPLFELRLGK